MSRVKGRRTRTSRAMQQRLHTLVAMCEAALTALDADDPERAMEILEVVLDHSGRPLNPRPPRTVGRRK